MGNTEDYTPGLIPFAEQLAKVLRETPPVKTAQGEFLLIERSAALEIARTLEKSAGNLKRVRFIPRGAEDPLPPIGDSFTVTEADVEAAVREWDQRTPERFRGLLDAEVTE
jgi:hypothetical protein